MTKMRKRILGVGCAALFAFGNIAVSMLTAFPAGIPVSAAASAATDGVKLEAYGGTLTETSVAPNTDGTLPELPVPTREGYDFVGWFTEPVEVNYWGDIPEELEGNGKPSWQKLKKKYGASAGYRYLNGRPTTWYDIPETPDPAYPDDAGYDWTNSRWIEHSVGLMNVTRGEKAEKGTVAAPGSTLYAMYDPKNITVYWYNNGWDDVHDTWAVTTGRSFGTEYGSKFAYLPLDNWEPWQGHEFKGWVDENGKRFDFDLDSAYQLTERFYTPDTYSPVLRLYAIYDNVTLPEGKPGNASFQRIVGDGGYFDPNTGSYTFTAIFDSRYMIYPEIKWEIVSGSEYFGISVSADKTSATVTAKPGLGEAIAKDGVNRRVDVCLTVGANRYNVSATAAHEWDNGKILSGLWDRCNSPMDVRYKCRNCEQTYIHTYPADGHRYTVYRSDATCTEDATEDRYCVVCGKTEHEILEGTATGHTWSVKKVSGCGGTITTSTCKSCGLIHTDEDHTACHSWNTYYTVDRAATCTTEGSKSIHCQNCDAVKESLTIPATGHHYKETRHSATCTESGYTVKTCSSCGDRVTETTSDPTGHDYKIETKTGCNGASCTVKTCRVCGDTETIGDPGALAHVPAADYTVEKAPTCTEKGTKTLRCTVCNTVIKRETIPATGHSYNVTSYDATCTKSGYTVSICSVCGDTVTETTSAPKGHHFDVTTQTGCNGAQYTTKTCLTCGEVETEGDLNAIAHVPAAEYVTDKAPTCTETGEQTLRCSVCNIVLDRKEIPAAGHKYKIVTHEATCTAGAYEVHTCTVCGDSYTETTSDPKGHTFDVVTQTGCNGAQFTTKTCRICRAVETEGDPDALAHTPAKDYTTEQAPTCTEAGEKTLRCAKCDIVLERAEIPATGHHYQSVAHDATCTASGYTVYTCADCEDSYTETTSDPKGHTFDVVTQTGCSGAVYTTKTCKVCRAVETEGDPDALAHTPARSYIVEKTPTCTETGEKVLRCAKCRVVLDRAEMPVIEHRYEKTVYEATCTESGRIVEKCARCGDVVTEITDAPKGHDFDVETEVGCGNAEFITKTCRTCGTVETVGDREALEHVEANYYSITKNPTCTGEGEKILRCAKCGIVLARFTIPASGHQYRDTTYMATCTDNGYTLHSCTVCGDFYTENVSAPNGHDFDVKTEVGCCKAEFITKTCRTCGTVETIGDRKALEHVASAEYTVEETRSCTEASEKVLRCAKCNLVLDRVTVPAAGHKYEETEHAATCTENGYITSICSVCGDTVIRTVSDPVGHEFEIETETGCCGAQFVTKTCRTCGVIETTGNREALAHHAADDYCVDTAPTCTEAGEKTLRCTKCDTILDRMTISPEGHDYIETRHAATCTEAGYIERICSVCGDSTTEITSDPTGHTAKTVTEREATCNTDGLKTVRCADCGCLLDSETLPADPSLHAWSEWETKKEGNALIKSRECEVCGEREEETVALEAAPQIAPETVPQNAPQVAEPAPQPNTQTAETVPQTSAEPVDETDSGKQLSATPVDAAETDQNSSAWLSITLGAIGGAAVLAIATLLILKRRKAGK